MTNSTSPVRVRYAPSPTGIPHIGNIRTALFNWLLARNTDGQFIVRFEDTDRTRYDERSERAIFESLEWLGLEWDEGPDKGGPYAPYIQSERKQTYIDAAERLVNSGHAYYDDTTPEQLHALRNGSGPRSNHRDTTGGVDTGVPKKSRSRGRLDCLSQFG